MKLLKIFFFILLIIFTCNNNIFLKICHQSSNKQYTEMPVNFLFENFKQEHLYEKILQLQVSISNIIINNDFFKIFKIKEITEGYIEEYLLKTIKNPSIFNDDIKYLFNIFFQKTYYENSELKTDIINTIINTYIKEHIENNIRVNENIYITQKQYKNKYIDISFQNESINNKLDLEKLTINYIDNTIEIIINTNKYQYNLNIFFIENVIIFLKTSERKTMNKELLSFIERYESYIEENIIKKYDIKSEKSNFLLMGSYSRLLHKDIYQQKMKLDCKFFDKIFQYIDISYSKDFYFKYINNFANKIKYSRTINQDNDNKSCISNKSYIPSDIATNGSAQIITTIKEQSFHKEQLIYTEKQKLFIINFIYKLQLDLKQNHLIQLNNKNIHFIFLQICIIILINNKIYNYFNSIYNEYYKKKLYFIETMKSIININKESESKKIDVNMNNFLKDLKEKTDDFENFFNSIDEISEDASIIFSKIKNKIINIIHHSKNNFHNLIKLIIKNILTQIEKKLQITIDINIEKKIIDFIINNYYKNNNFIENEGIYLSENKNYIYYTTEFINLKNKLSSFLHPIIESIYKTKFKNINVCLEDLYKLMMEVVKVINSTSLNIQEKNIQKIQLKNKIYKYITENNYWSIFNKFILDSMFQQIKDKKYNKENFNVFIQINYQKKMMDSITIDQLDYIIQLYCVIRERLYCTSQKNFFNNLINNIEQFIYLYWYDIDLKILPEIQKNFDNLFSDKYDNLYNKIKNFIIEHKELWNDSDQKEYYNFNKQYINENIVTD